MPDTSQMPDMAYLESLLDSLNVDGYVDKAVEDARNSENKVPVACWAYRGCSGLMGLEAPLEMECPHSRQDCYNPCPVECSYTACSRPWHKVTADFDLIFDESVDRQVALKKSCYTCAYFLKNAPRVSDRVDADVLVPDTATRDSDSRVTIHLF